MERDEMKEKQERSMSKTMNAFLMAGKVDMKQNLEEEISHIQLGNQEHQHVRLNNKHRPIAQIEKSKGECFVDSRTASNHYWNEITSDVPKERPLHRLNQYQIQSIILKIF